MRLIKKSYFFKVNWFKFNARKNKDGLLLNKAESRPIDASSESPRVTQSYPELFRVTQELPRVMQSRQEPP